MIIYSFSQYWNDTVESVRQISLWILPVEKNSRMHIKIQRAIFFIPGSDSFKIFHCFPRRRVSQALTATTMSR